MKFNCNIDGENYSLNENSDKPLSKILQEKLDTFPVNNSCLGANCGNCIVLLNGEFVLSCLVPAFRLSGATILTFDGFRKTRGWHDIEKAYQEVGAQPCEQCFASKTMLIESVIHKIESERSMKTSRGRQHSPVNREMIASEIGVSKCNCIDAAQLEKIVMQAYQFRSKRSGRHS